MDKGYIPRVGAIKVTLGTEIGAISTLFQQHVDKHVSWNISSVSDCCVSNELLRAVVIVDLL